MIKLVLFLCVLVVMCVFDILKMRRLGLKRELIPYILVAAAAVTTAVCVFTGPLRASLLGAAFDLFGVL